MLLTLYVATCWWRTARRWHRRSRIQISPQRWRLHRRVIFPIALCRPAKPWCARAVVGLVRHFLAGFLFPSYRKSKNLHTWGEKCSAQWECIGIQNQISKEFASITCRGRGATVVAGGTHYRSRYDVIWLALVGKRSANAKLCAQELRGQKDRAHTRRF